MIHREFFLYEKNSFLPSFTLLELLLVIGLIAVLGSVTFVALNPVETLRVSRDIQRIADLDALNKAINMAVVENTSMSLGNVNTVYISLPDSSPICASYSLPTLPSGWSYRCAASSTYILTNGTGWLPIDFTSFSTGSPVSRDASDPVNNATYYYEYVSNPSQKTWELASVLESTKYRLGGQDDKTSTDGGQNLSLYEKGTDLTLVPVDNGDQSLVGWWKFDETSWVNNCSTATALDSSGKGNNGKSCPNGTGPTTPVKGKVGNAGTFDGSQNFTIPNASNLNFGTNSFTLMTWLNIQEPYPGSGYNQRRPIQKYDPGYILRAFVNSGGFITGTFYMYDGTNVYDRQGGSFQNYTWAHLAVVRDRSSGKGIIYLNGQAVSNSTDNVGSLDNAQSLILGASGFIGYMDETRIYNRALSVSEIRAIYNATK